VQLSQPIPITIGIIGVSGSAYKRTLPALKDSALCKVLAIQCRNLEQGNQIAKEFDIPEVYQSVEEMLRRSSFAIAYIATPPFRHLYQVASLR
jgi:predicted dehydrogenase